MIQPHTTQRLGGYLMAITAYTARIGQSVLITTASGAGEAGFLVPRAARDVPYQLAVPTRCS
jgi:hypothetical protein